MNKVLNIPQNAKSFFANKVILITGCNGFLGRRFVSYLINILNELENNNQSETHHVYAIDNGITSTPAKVNFPKYITPIDDNAITHDYTKLKNVDIIFHMAGLASPAQYKKYPLETIDVATTLTRTLLDFAVKWKAKFIFFSSSEIYGNPFEPHIPTPESFKGFVACQGPRACYDESKRMGETLCHVYSNYYDVYTNIIRPFNVYGPGMSKFDYRMVPNMLKCSIEKKPIQIYGSGTQTRTFCYIDDAVIGIILIASTGRFGETYNLGNDKPEVSMIDLVKIFGEATGIENQVEIIDYPENYPADEPLRRCPDLTKIRSHLGYEPEVNLQAGLKKSYQWALDNYL